MGACGCWEIFINLKVAKDMAGQMQEHGGPSYKGHIHLGPNPGGKGGEVEGSQMGGGEGWEEGDEGRTGSHCQGGMGQI